MKKTDLLIIGAGPAGCSAAIYAVRAGLKTVIAGGAMPGGQLLQTSEIENYAGFIDPVGGSPRHFLPAAAFSNVFPYMSAQMRRPFCLPALTA